MTTELKQQAPDPNCWRCKGSGQRSMQETLGSPGDHPCPVCRVEDYADLLNRKMSETGGNS